MREKWIILLILAVILMSSLALASPELISNNKQGWVGVNDSDMTVNFAKEIIQCQYRYCPFELELDPSIQTCINTQKLTFLTYPEKIDLNPHFIIDDSWHYDGTIFQCTCKKVFDKFLNEITCVYPDRHINLTEYFCFNGDTNCIIPKIYDPNKDYCMNTTKIYSQEYYDFQKGKICIEDKQNKIINGYFIADPNSFGKFNVNLDYLFKDYLIDPYWITSNSSWNNGTYNYTKEAMTGELQMFDSVSDTKGFLDNNGVDWNRNMSGSEYLYHFENNTNDSSGNNNDFTNHGANLAAATTKIAGNYSVGIGLNDYLELPTTNLTDDTYGTIAGWVEPSITGGNQNFFTVSRNADLNYTDINIQAYGTGGNTYFSFFCRTDNVIKYWIYSIKPVFFTDYVANGDWVFYTIVHNGTDTQLFLNGHHLETTKHTDVDRTCWFDDLFSATYPADIATLGAGVRDGNTTYNPFAGKMDEFVLFDRVLSEEEIRSLYSSTKGNYIRTFNANTTAQWKNLSWVQDSIYNLAELPNNQASDTESYVKNKFDMSNNVLLMHLNNDSSVGENSTHVYDYSSEGNNGTITNAVWSSTKKLGNASMYFDGSGDEISVADSSSLDISGSMSVSAWIKMDDTDTDATIRNIAGKFVYSGSSSNSGWVFDVHPASKGHVLLFSVGNNNYGYTQGVTDLEDGNWHYVTGTYNSSGTPIVKCYVDGKLENRNGYLVPSSIGLNNQKVSIGGRQTANIYDSGRWFKGNIDEFAIFNKTLSQEEINQMFLRGEGKFNISVRSCDDINCNGESWNETYITSPQNLSVINNQYFQYKINFERYSIPALLSPEVWNLTIGYETIYNQPPNVTLNSPANNSNLTTIPVTLNATCTDAENTTMNMSFVVNDILVNYTTANNNTPVTYDYTNINGNYTWYVNCTDLANQTTKSEIRNFQITAIDSFNFNVYRYGLEWIIINWKPVNETDLTNSSCHN